MRRGAPGLAIQRQKLVHFAAAENIAADRAARFHHIQRSMLVPVARQLGIVIEINTGTWLSTESWCARCAKLC